ncbi:MAG: hypothetical protein NVS4B7_12190 [Ktedonobacteraceae bacterium]
MASTPPSQHITQQQTIPLPSTPMPPMPPVDIADPSQMPVLKQNFRRIVPIFLALASIAGIYFIWSTTTTPPAPTANAGFTQQNLGSGSSTTMVKNSTGNTAATTGDIQVYIVGAVKHPGVYTLSADARVFELLQAAGGPLPEANLVALNLAAKLTDGEEVYVMLIGEVPPTYMGGVPGPGTGTIGSPTTGQPVNINTASVDEMRQSLHISSTTAQTIVNYRLQHGSYTSVDQLQQVVSKAIYDKIRNQVTVA